MTLCLVCYDISLCSTHLGGDFSHVNVADTFESILFRKLRKRMVYISKQGMGELLLLKVTALMVF